MGDIGYGYGSECHLLRWMGRHRSVFDKLLLKAMGLKEEALIAWMDFDFKSGKLWPDKELKGLEFLKGTQYRGLQKKWAEFWPLGGGIHNWDAVGWLKANGKQELLLLEAKAHLGEIVSDCGAVSKDSIKKIEEAFHQVKSALHVPADQDWVKRYYQFTNRVATLHFLQTNGIDARLIFVYFIGDTFDAERRSPQAKKEWEQALSDQAEWVGLPSEHALMGRIHKVFLRVDGENVE